MAEWPVSALAAAPLPSDAAALVDELRELEELKCAAEARQARLAARLDAVRAGGGVGGLC